MKNSLLIFLTFIVLLYSCEKSSYKVENDPKYPTIIKKVEADRLSSLRSEFAQQNEYLRTSLDKYAFCGLAEDLTMAPDPPVDTTTSRSEAIEIAKEFIVKNSKFIGVKEINNLQFRVVEIMSGFWDGNKVWHLRTSSQRFDTIEVLFTSILINIRGKEVYYCIGNWFPDIYIPKEFNCNSSKAKESLLNRTVTHYGWGGPSNAVITSESLQKSTTSLIVLPIEGENQIELHLAWCINIPQVYYIIYVDVMTGEVIGQEPTIIS
ncbi:MAG: hypothetical protein Q8868_13560 [Bacteroidota bacterium]|nr:hypothetical protein [Bacteroidota bacterium]